MRACKVAHGLRPARLCSSDGLKHPVDEYRFGLPMMNGRPRAIESFQSRRGISVYAWPGLVLEDGEIPNSEI